MKTQQTSENMSNVNDETSSSPTTPASRDGAVSRLAQYTPPTPDDAIAGETSNALAIATCSNSGLFLAAIQMLRDNPGLADRLRQQYGYTRAPTTEIEQSPLPLPTHSRERSVTKRLAEDDISEEPAKKLKIGNTDGTYEDKPVQVEVRERNRSGLKKHQLCGSFHPKLH
jgi:hypothetical protein